VRLGGIASGALALVALQVIVTSQQTARIAGLFALPAAAARWLISPDVPGIPDHTKPAAAKSTSTTSVTIPAPLPAPPRSTIDYGVV
jgi:hypothetical protein